MNQKISRNKDHAKFKLIIKRKSHKGVRMYIFLETEKKMPFFTINFKTGL